MRKESYSENALPSYTEVSRIFIVANCRRREAEATTMFLFDGAQIVIVYYADKATGKNKV